MSIPCHWRKLEVGENACLTELHDYLHVAALLGKALIVPAPSGTCSCKALSMDDRGLTPAA